MSDPYDYLILGSGMSGLTVGSLLAKAGKKVCILEAHDHPGGCAHSFPMGRFTFCAAVHYIFFCGEGEPVYNFLKKLDLHREVEFTRLDPEGYDHFRCPAAGIEFRIPNGLDKWADRLIDRFPEARTSIVRFFAVIHRLIEEVRAMPFFLSWKDYLSAPLKFGTVLKYRAWTLQRLFEKLHVPPIIQAILATQIGDLGLPPSRVSLVLFAALIWSYSSGAYYPTKHFKHFIDSVARVVQGSPGCGIEYGAEVCSIQIQHGNAEVETRDQRKFVGRTLISNMDPRACVEMIGSRHFPAWFRKKVEYAYSVSSFSIYLGLRGIDLRAHGFGRWNVWHYPHLDINRVYRTQLEQNDLGNPWLFLSTPSLYSPGDHASICPEGDQILQIVTVASYDYFRALRESDRKAYQRHKRAVMERILDLVESHYIPGLRKHIVLKLAGSPTTNDRYLWAPAGNIYGSELSPANVHFNRLKFKTPIPNLFFTGASAEFPSVGGTVIGGSRLYTYLTGDSVNPGRDGYGLL